MSEREAVFELARQYPEIFEQVRAVFRGYWHSTPCEHWTEAQQIVREADILAASAARQRLAAIGVICEVK